MLAKADSPREPWHVRMRLQQLKDWMTLGEAAEVLGISRQAVHRLVERGSITARTLGNRPIIVVHVRSVQSLPVSPQRRRKLELRAAKAGDPEAELSGEPPEG